MDKLTVVSTSIKWLNKIERPLVWFLQTQILRLWDFEVPIICTGPIIRTVLISGGS